MTTKETQGFLDSVIMKFDFTAEELANPKLIEQTTGIRFSTGYDHARYQSFSKIIKKVCDSLVLNDIELNGSLNIEGLIPQKDGPLMRFVPAGREVNLYRSDFDIRPLTFKSDDEIHAITYILTLWQNAYMQQVDPDALVRARLKEHGITDWDSFEANKERLMISNPFTPPV